MQITFNFSETIASIASVSGFHIESNASFSSFLLLLIPFRDKRVHELGIA